MANHGTPPAHGRVLVAEDDRSVRDSLVRALTFEGYEVHTATDGAEALVATLETDPDVIVLDVLMPNVDGLTACRKLRERGDRTPVLMLTARHEVSDRVAGLDAGADDYLVKPFDFGELLARIRALQRRPRGVDAPAIMRGALTLDPVRREVTSAGRVLPLTATEYNILELLMRRSPAVVDRKAIAEHGWDDETDPLGSNAIDVQLSRLRAKLPSAGVRIVTVRGAGYRLEES
jgi:two-component system response regulator MprA